MTLSLRRDHYELATEAAGITGLPVADLIRVALVNTLIDFEAKGLLAGKGVAA